MAGFVFCGTGDAKIAGAQLIRLRNSFNPFPNHIKDSAPYESVSFVMQPGAPLSINQAGL